MRSIIKTNQLSYFFGQQKILDGLSLEVPESSIYAFLGPNGAGKTTTIKILLGLLPVVGADIKLFGQSLQEGRIDILSKIGALIEQPALYEHLTGWENLWNRARLLGKSRNQVAELLDLVHLSGHGHKKAGKYSLGMKQRLGIALSLVGDPELLILDEPTNGLDPNGIIEMRNMLRDLVNHSGKTVFVSSHLLAEVEKIATHVGIIDQGKLLFQGALSDLLGHTSHIRAIRTDQPIQALHVLSTYGFQVHEEQDSIQIHVKSEEDIAKANTLLVHANIKVFSIEKVHVDLENRFLHITRSV